MCRTILVDEVIAAMPKKQQEAIAKRRAELVAKVRRRMTLAKLGKGRKISRATMAEAQGIGQMQISRLEKRKDPRLSTMARKVAAMGGHRTMIATFPDREPVVLIPTQLGGRPTRRATSARCESCYLTSQKPDGRHTAVRAFTCH